MTREQIETRIKELEENRHEDYRELKRLLKALEKLNEENDGNQKLLLG
jgi:hypothetical protein